VPTSPQESSDQQALARDLACMRSLAAGDDTTLEPIYQRHSGLVMAVALRVVHDHAEAEQVVIDVFFELWRTAANYDPQKSSPRNYLVRLARSRAIDRLRRSKTGHSGMHRDQALDGDMAALTALE
jgi:RNA polymerase sigma-70 factor (ECF subfamily)